MKKELIDQGTIDALVVKMGALLRDRYSDTLALSIYGVPKGGSHVAELLIKELPLNWRLLRSEKELERQDPSSVVVVDDLIDSGTTRERFKNFAFMAVYSKREQNKHEAVVQKEPGVWLVFPWERTVEEEGPTDAVLRLLQFIGEDPEREGLAGTPERVIRALSELTSGYNEDPKKILGTSFIQSYDEMVVVKAIPFWSLCEHHLMPFHGKVDIGYIPTDKVVGLSKIPRLVRCFSRRLQIQERLTVQIANAIQDNLETRGVGVVVSAHHTCMEMRGVQSHGEMVTSCLLHRFRQPEVREEFLRLTSSGTSSST